MADYKTQAQINEEYQRKVVAWNKATPIASYPADIIRQDCDGRIIRWDQYGLRSDYGWEIDHITPVALGGSDAFVNLRARHWLGNSSAGGRLGNALNNGRR
jgi:hypothetical protein